MRVHKERQVEYVPGRGGCSRKVAVPGGGGEVGVGGGTALNEAIRNI